MARSARHDVWVARNPWRLPNFFYALIKCFMVYPDWLSLPFRIGMSGLFLAFPATMRGKPLILLIFGPFTGYSSDSARF